MIILDSCTLILLAKASVLEKLLDTKSIGVTVHVLQEVLSGKEKMFPDALLIDKLDAEGKIKRVEDNPKLTNKIAQDFNMGLGEASTISAALDRKGVVGTDNLQGRKAAQVNGLGLIGSPEVIVYLYRQKWIDKMKALDALQTLQREGWFSPYIIEKAREEMR